MTARLGVGLAAAGRPAYITLGHDEDQASGRSVEGLRRLCHQILDAAWDGGIRYVDAARSYGLAELFLGEWLERHPGRRDELSIGSKWGYRYVGGWRRDAPIHEVKRHSLPAFRRQWPETLVALRTRPDFYLIHSVTPESPALDDAALRAELTALADSGVRVGLSTSGPQQADVIRRALDIGLPFSSVQASWNLLETSSGAALAEAHDAGWFVAVKEALANGRLTQRGETPGLATAAEVAGATQDAVALAVALAQPWADAVLSGAATPEQLESNRAAVHVADAADAGAGVRPEDPVEYWATRSRLPWI